MFLKRIELFGFKSFADRTVIELNDGITALLGPNGCGKSNIVDAIKWVLGEQSVRNMRAERMEDVIFSGTEERKALSVAEVTLVIENQGLLLPQERPEIAIKRRLFREGESEYFLNGDKVLLKDIREIFFDTGVGKSAYSVMEQGRIDQVLSTKPEERRYIFEEAAGITKYKIRGSEAERKLERTSENMIQVENILREVRRSYEALEKQTAKTLEYRRCREEIFGLDRDLRLLQWRGFLEEKKKKEDRLVDREKKLEETAGKIQGIKKTLETDLDRVNGMESRLIENQKRLYGIDLEIENQEQQIRMLRENRAEIDASLESTSARERTNSDSLASLEKQKKDKEGDIEGFKERLRDIDGRLGAQAKTIETVESRLDGNAAEATKTEREITDEETKREGLQEDIRGLTDDIVRELDQGLAKVGFDRTARRSLEEEIEKALAEIGIHIEGQADILEDAKITPDAGNTAERIDAVGKALGSLAVSVEDVRRRFDEYKATAPDFLGEFLAPEGIITRKRDLDEKISSTTIRIRDLKERLKGLAGEREQLSAKLEETRDGLEELRVAQARTVTQVAAAEDSLEALRREAESEEERLAEIRRRIVADQTRIKGIDDQIQGIMDKRAAMEASRKNLEGELENLEIGITDENEKMADRESKLRNHTDKRGRLELEREKARLEITHVDDEIRILKDEFRERNAKDLSAFESRMETLTKGSKELREELAESKRKLKDLGQVNLMAPEEFAEVSERYEFLTNQLEDLRKAKEDLNRITEEIRQESANLFLSTFRDIRDHFHETFRRLFGGGRAEVKLTDTTDPLNAGIEILAQPPGKKLESISLLSGGERSLCGVALMFATFQVRPSPFCILDEIDAALDEANIQRFINLLLEFGESSQFVVITHSKKTVAGARTLLGVTMQESGVSRLISLRLDGREVDDEEPVGARR